MRGNAKDYKCALPRCQNHCVIDLGEITPNYRLSAVKLRGETHLARSLSPTMTSSDASLQFSDPSAVTMAIEDTPSGGGPANNHQLAIPPLPIVTRTSSSGVGASCQSSGPIRRYIGTPRQRASSSQVRRTIPSSTRVVGPCVTTRNSSNRALRGRKRSVSLDTPRPSVQSAIDRLKVDLELKATEVEVGRLQNDQLSKGYDVERSGRIAAEIGRAHV